MAERTSGGDGYEQGKTPTRQFPATGINQNVHLDGIDGNFELALGPSYIYFNYSSC